jgi:hypothetical protein
VKLVSIQIVIEGGDSVSVFRMDDAEVEKLLDGLGGKYTRHGERKSFHDPDRDAVIMVSVKDANYSVKAGEVLEEIASVIEDPQGADWYFS